MRHFIFLLICTLLVFKCKFSTTETSEKSKKKQKKPPKSITDSPANKTITDKDTDSIKTGATIPTEDGNHKDNTIVAEVNKDNKSSIDDTKNKISQNPVSDLSSKVIIDKESSFIKVGNKMQKVSEKLEKNTIVNKGDKSSIDDTKNKISQKPVSASPSSKTITDKESNPIKTNTTQKENERNKDSEVNKDEKLLRDDLKNKNFISYSANKIIKLLTDLKLLSPEEIEDLKKSNYLNLDNIYEKVLKLLYTKLLYQDGKIESLINNIKNDKNIVLSELLVTKLKQFKKHKDPPFGLAAMGQKEFMDCDFDKTVFNKINYKNYIFYRVTHDGKCGFESFIVLFLLQLDTNRKVKKIMNIFKGLIDKYTLKKHEKIIYNAKRSSDLSEWFKSKTAKQILELVKNKRMLPKHYRKVLKILNRKIDENTNFQITLKEKDLLIDFFRYIFCLVGLERDEYTYDIVYKWLEVWFRNPLLISFTFFLRDKHINFLYFPYFLDEKTEHNPGDLQFQNGSFDIFNLTTYFYNKVPPSDYKAFHKDYNSYLEYCKQMSSKFGKKELPLWLTYPISYDKALLYFKDNVLIDPIIKKEPIENEWFSSEIIEKIYKQALIKDKDLLIKVIKGTAPIDTFLETELKTKTTLLHILTQQNDLEQIKILVEIRKAKLNIKDSLGNYPLHYAYESDFIADNNKKVIKYLKKQMTNQSISLEDEKKLYNSLVDKLKNMNMNLINSLNSYLLKYRSGSLKYLNKFRKENELFSTKNFESYEDQKTFEASYRLSKSLSEFNKKLFKKNSDLLRIVGLLLKNNIKHRTITTLDYLVGYSIFENDFNYLSILVEIFNTTENTKHLQMALIEISKDWKIIIEDLNSEI